MDPNLFRLDWERTAEVLAAVVVMSFVLERALSILFGHRWWIAVCWKKGLKEPIAFGVAAFVCWLWSFDAVSMILVTTDTVTFPGTLITAGVIAGGSQGSVKLFRDVLGFRSTAENEAIEKDAQDAGKKQGDADAEIARLKVELNALKAGSK
jgi:hypothetical protein